MKIPFITREPAIPTNLFEIQFTDYPNNKGYLRELAIRTVVGYIARAVAQSKFRYVKGGKRQYNDLDYLLNVQPNLSQSASEFWNLFTYKLITENEVLVIFSDDGQMLIADCFERTEYALYPDTFSKVTYRDYTYERNFLESDVIYLKYSNSNVLKYMNQMFTDYSNLYNNIYTSQMRNNQVRGVLKIDSNQSQDERTRNATQELVNRIFKSFSEKAVSIIPLFKGFEYNEISSGGSNGTSATQSMEVLSGLTNELADILGVPRALLHGEVNNLDSSIKAFIKFCLNPIFKMIEDELNAKIVGKEHYLDGERIQIIGIKALDILENATAIDKAISSSAFTPNEVRIEAGHEPSDDPKLDEHILTKNYETMNNVTTLEGGENN